MALEDLTGGSVYIDSFVNTNPTSSDTKSQGDDHLRGIKNVLLNTFPNVTGAVTSSHTELNLLDGRSMASSDDVIDNFPTTTSMTFQQTAAPTGWTKGATHNDKGLRVVTGTASSGGTDAFTTTFSSSKASESHTLLVTEIPSHSHGAGTATGASLGSTPPDTYAIPWASGSGNSPSGIANLLTGGGGGHTHDITMDLQYVDVILASKD